MDILERLDDDILILNVRGDLDASSSVKMDECIKVAYEAQHFKIVVNCTELNYISSAGIGVFISYLEDFKARQGKFAFCCLKENVHQTFDILGLNHVINLVADEQTAKRLMNEG